MDNRTEGQAVGWKRYAPGLTVLCCVVALLGLRVLALVARGVDEHEHRAAASNKR